MKALITTTDHLSAAPWPQLRAIADSAVARQREPIWLDTDDSRQMCAVICPCYRIGRLGLNISRRFALRYIDAVGLAAVVLPAEYAAAPVDAPPVLYVCNGAMVLGDEVDPQQLGDSPWTLQVSALNNDGNTVTAHTVTAGMEFAGLAVSELSQLMTFKTGDRLLDAGHSVTVPLAKGSHLSGSLHSIPLLHCKAL